MSDTLNLKKFISLSWLTVPRDLIGSKTGWRGSGAEQRRGAQSRKGDTEKDKKGARQILLDHMSSNHPLQLGSTSQLHI